MIRKLVIVAAAAALVFGGTSAALAATSPPRPPAPLPPQVRACVVVTFGWETATGHEADAPVTVCGAGLRPGLQCQLNTPGLAPGTAADCYPSRKP